MTKNNKQFIAYGTKKNILDYINIFFPKHYVVIDEKPGAVLPEKTVYIFSKAEKNIYVPIVFFLEPATNAIYISDDLIIDEASKYFDIALNSEEKSMILKFAPLESIYYLIFKYKISKLPLSKLINPVLENPITFIIKSQFKLKSDYKHGKITKDYFKIFSSYLTKMENIFLNTGNYLVIDFIKHMKNIII